MLRVFFFLGVLNIGFLYGQTSDSLTEVNTSIKDTLKQGLFRVQQMEERFHNELYANNLYGALKDSITNQSIEVVYYPELPTDTLKKRLAILDAKTPFNIKYNPSLESVIKGYLKRRQRSTETLMRLSRYYFPMFEEVLDKHNLPLEIKYLAIVESSLKPRAKSRVGATGLWQFMFSTGKQYGL